MGNISITSKNTHQDLINHHTLIYHQYNLPTRSPYRSKSFPQRCRQHSPQPPFNLPPHPVYIYIYISHHTTPTIHPSFPHPLPHVTSTSHLLQKMAHSRILTLANIISSNTSLINSHLSAQNLPTPSFDPEVPADLLSGHGAEFEEARQNVVEATDELRTLLLGPKEYLMGIYVSFDNSNT